MLSISALSDGKKAKSGAKKADTGGKQAKSSGKKAQTGGQKAAEYFDPVQYYQRDDILADQNAWFGAGAAALGLTGPVDMNRFGEVLDGKLSADVQLGRKVAGEQEHQQGWDLTFSAPKSLSILALIGGDERLIEAHKAAVDSTLQILEKEFVITRLHPTKDKVVEVRSESLVAAKFLHSESREEDPQLHTHCAIANATLRQDGKWRSIHSVNFYDHKMLLGQIYRNELALQVKQLGYELDLDYQRGFFDIKGVPKGVLEVFSKRSAEIKEMADGGGAAEKERAALLTRKNKGTRRGESLLNKWLNEAKKAGFSLKNMLELVTKSQEKIPEAQPELHDAAREVQQAVKHLAMREAVFARRSLGEKALQFGLGESRYADVSKCIDRVVEDKEIVPSNLAIRGRLAESFTTHGAQRRENYILRLLEAGKGKQEKITHKWKVAEHVQKHDSLTKGQKLAVELIATSKDQFIGVQGFAGVGKTTMLRCLKTLVEDNTYQLRALAPTHSAVDSLTAETGIEARTLASFLYEKELQRAGKDPGSAPDLNGEEVVIGKPPAQVTDCSREIWLVDEASLIEAKQVASLMTFARKSGAKVVLVGDRAQLGAVGWGKPFHLMIKRGMACAVMDEIMRQKNCTLKQAVEKTIEAVSKQKPWLQLGSAFKAEVDAAKEVLNAALQNVTVWEQGDRDKRHTELVESYGSLEPKERENALVIIPDRETRHDLMPALREIAIPDLHKRRFLNAKVFWSLECSDPAYAKNYVVGAVVEFQKSYRSIGVKAGERFVVNGVDGKNNTVTLASYETPNNPDRLFCWDPKAVGGKSKGGVKLFEEREISLVVGEEIIFTTVNREMGIKNGDRATIKEIDHKKMEILTKGEDGQEVRFNCTNFRHFDHGYADTCYRAQGKTVDHVLFLAESYRLNLVTQRSTYVAISRARISATIFTNDRGKLIEGLAGRPGEKTSAIEQREMEKIVKMQKSPDIVSGPVHSPSSKGGFDIGLDF